MSHIESKPLGINVSKITERFLAAGSAAVFVSAAFGTGTTKEIPELLQDKRSAIVFTQIDKNINGSRHSDDALRKRGLEYKNTSERNRRTFTAVATGYYPDNSEMEGGYNDMRGKPLQTLQDFLAGKDKFVAVAMDDGILPYGTRLESKELNKKFGKNIDLRVVDFGGDFEGKGFSRIDICTKNADASEDKRINKKLTFTVKKLGSK
jgi:hypothetical protein